MEYELIRSKRRTVAVEINQEAKIIVRAPHRMSIAEIKAIILQHESWIIRQQEKKSAMESQRKTLSKAEIAGLIEQGKNILPARIAFYSQLMGLCPTNVKITTATTRWGSCSVKNALCFSYRLLLLPDELIDYVVVHEMVHILVKNHGVKFYQLVAKYLPDYQVRIKKIKSLAVTLPRSPKKRKAVEDYTKEQS
ncbi:MAG: M48 family metallopeptidase [Clostridia bacterium]